MFLAYQRASRPYKRLVFDDFTFCIFYIVSQFIFWGGRRNEALMALAFTGSVVVKTMSGGMVCKIVQALIN